MVQGEERQIASRSPVPEGPGSEAFSDLPSLKRTARRLIHERGSLGVTDEEIARACLRTDAVDRALAARLVHSLLGEDRRFRRTGDGRWHPADEPGSGTSLSAAVFTVVDVETTGTTARGRIIEVGAVRVSGLEITGSYQSLIDPGVVIPWEITQMTGITQEMVDGSPGPAEVLGGLVEFMGDTVFTAHNAPFDRGFVFREARRYCGLTLSNPVLCTRLLARRALPDLGGYSLDRVASQLGYEIEDRHRALGDALAAAHALIASCRKLGEMGVDDVGTLLRVQRKQEFDRFLRERDS
jgi:DNA polymerase III epsilon subunit family exonuclease